MKALILAAGYATRLYPLTKEFPKPLLSINDRPLIDYIIDKIKTVDEIDEVIVVTNSKFISKFKAWAKTIDTGKKISLVDDLTKSINTRLGAIGDMNFAINKKHIKDDLLVVAGDNIFKEDLNGFLSFARKNKNNPVIGVFDIKSKAKARGYGVVKLSRQKKVVDFNEKPKKPNSTLVATCVYYFPKDKVSLIKEYLSDASNRSDATGLYIDWLRKKECVSGFIFKKGWYDIGDFVFYNKARKEFSK